MIGFIAAVVITIFILICSWFLIKKFKRKGLGRIYEYGEDYFWEFELGNRTYKSNKRYSSISKARKSLYDFLKGKGLI